jgi:hypothetical protein
MTRLKQIEEAYETFEHVSMERSFYQGVLWADEHPDSDLDLRLSSAFVSSTMIGARDHIISGLEQQLAIAVEALKLFDMLCYTCGSDSISKEALAKIEAIK